MEYNFSWNKNATNASTEFIRLTTCFPAHSNSVNAKEWAVQ